MRVQCFLLALVFSMVNCSASELKKKTVFVSATKKKQAIQEKNPHPFAKKWDNQSYIWKKFHLKNE